MGEEGEDAYPLRLRVVDVSSHSLGIEGVDPVSGRRVNTILIPRYTPLPANVSHRFVTKQANQASVAIKVLEGEGEDPESCLTVGKVVMRDLPHELPRNHPIEVIYYYERNGRLHVELKLVDTDHAQTVVLQRETGLSDGSIKKWNSVVAGGSSFARLAEVLESVLGIVADVDASPDEAVDES